MSENYFSKKIEFKFLCIVISIMMILPMFVVNASAVESVPSLDATNSGFEDDLAEWTTYGAISIEKDKMNIEAGSNKWEIQPKGQKMAVLYPSGSSGVFDSVATTLGLSQDSKDYIKGIFPGPTDFGYIYRDLELEAGDEFIMGWNYIATDYEPYNDASFVSLVNIDDSTKLPVVNSFYGEVGILGATVKGTGNYSTGSYGSTGWQTATFKIVNTGTYRLGFAVYNLDDTINPPYLFIDDGLGKTLLNGQIFEPIKPDDSAPPPPSVKSVVYDKTEFLESDKDDGSIDTTAVLTLQEDTFTGSLNTTMAGVSFDNLPDGLVPSVVKTSDTTVELKLEGNAKNHTDSYDISNFTVTFSDSCFTSNDASGVIGSTTDILKITFNESDDSTFTVKYYAGDNGSIIGDEIQTVTAGGITTTVSAISHEGYHLTKWSDGFKSKTRTDSNISSNVEFTANFEINQYTVSFRDYNDTVLKIEKVNHGSDATPPDDPHRRRYDFRRWDTDFTNVTADMTVKAIYKKEKAEAENPVQKEETNDDGETIVRLNVDSTLMNNELNKLLGDTAGDSTRRKLELKAEDKDVNQVIGTLSGDTVEKLEQKNYDIIITMDGVKYSLPASEIDIKNVAKEMGLDEDDVEDINIEISIKHIAQTQNILKYMEATKKDCEIVFPPVEFEISATTELENGQIKKMEVSSFSGYIAREIEIPKDSDHEHITTGVVFNEDDTMSHIPTVVYMTEGMWYAKLNSMTNSTYSIIWNPITVESVANHWSKDIVNDMASRLIIENIEDFSPDDSITRGDYAEYITKALGLFRSGTGQTSKFNDSNDFNELNDAIVIASEKGIIKGYPDGSFRPNDEITREEAMVMFARAMDLIGMDAGEENRISNYTDKDKISNWAYDSVEKVINSHVFNGKTESTIDTKGSFTYAEAATAIRNLLIEANLINE
jgi:hypothetical protein